MFLQELKKLCALDEKVKEDKKMPAKEEAIAINLDKKVWVFDPVQYTKN